MSCLSLIGIKGMQSHLECLIFLGHVSTDIFMTINDVISGADFEENMKPAPGNENFFPFFF